MMIYDMARIHRDSGLRRLGVRFSDMRADIGQAVQVGSKRKSPLQYFAGYCRDYCCDYRGDLAAIAKLHANQ